jgi:multicomponent Na+:H+ antiporter subunit E
MFAANLLLAFVWSVMTEQLTLPSLGSGFFLGYVLLLFLHPLLGDSRYFGKVGQVLRFGGFFVKELIVANLRVAWHVVTPASFFKPGIVAVPLEPMSALEVTLLANVITLTPGSFSVDLSEDRRTLYVHVMDVDDPDQVRLHIKAEYERPLLEVLR